MADHFRDPGTRVTLGRHDQITVEQAREVLEAVRGLDYATATDRDLCRMIGRAEWALEALLRIVDQPPTP